MASVFSSVQRDRSTFLFSCSTSSTWTTDVQNILETPEPRPKQNIDVQNLENILRIPLWCFSLEFFGLHQRVSILFCLLRYFATQWMSKNPKGSPLLHFSALWHCSKISFWNFFRKFLISQGSPFNYFRILKPTGVSQSPKVPLLQFWALDIAPTLAVPGLFVFVLITP